FRDLVENSLARLGAAADGVSNNPADIDILTGILYRAFSISDVRAHREPPRLTTNISVRPAASLLARRQAESQAVVTTLDHNPLRLDDEIRRLLLLVDGSRTVPELIRDFGSLTDKDKQSIAPDAVEINLAKLAKFGLLIA